MDTTLLASETQITCSIVVVFWLFHIPLTCKIYLRGFFFFCLPSYISGASSTSAFPAISQGLLLLPSSYISGTSTSSALPAISQGLLLLLPSQLYIRDFYFFCLPSYISGTSSSSAFPAIYQGLLLLPSQLYLRDFYFCFPSYISGTSTSSVFPAISQGLLLLLPSQLYTRDFYFFCLPSYISGTSSTSAFPAISQGLLLHLPSQLYLWASPFFFFCLPSYISGVHILPLQPFYLHYSYHRSTHYIDPYNIHKDLKTFLGKTKTKQTNRLHIKLAV